MGTASLGEEGHTCTVQQGCCALAFALLALNSGQGPTSALCVSIHLWAPGLCLSLGSCEHAAVHGGAMNTLFLVPNEL